MRRLTVPAIGALLAGTCLALLAPITARAADRGTIAGTVLNGRTGRGQPGVEVRLTRTRPDGVRIGTSTVLTDRRGRYGFSGLATGSAIVYTLDAVHDGGLFPGRSLRLPDDTSRPPAIDADFRVWDTTTDPTAILVRRDDVFAVPSEDRLTIVEAVTVANTSDLAYIGRGGGREAAGRSPTLGFALPARAIAGSITIREASFDVPGIERTDFGFAIHTAVPPGRSRVTFVYEVPGSGGTFDLGRNALYPTLEMSVFARDPLRLETNRLRAAGEVEIGGERYERYTSTGTLDAGDPVQILALAEASLGPLLVGTLVLGALAAAGAGFYALRRRRRARSTPARSAAPRHEPGDRDGLVAAIAALDLELRAGTIERSDWERRRGELKARLERFEAPATR